MVVVVVVRLCSEDVCAVLSFRCFFCFSPSGSNSRIGEGGGGYSEIKKQTIVQFDGATTSPERDLSGKSVLRCRCCPLPCEMERRTGLWGKLTQWKELRRSKIVTVNCIENVTQAVPS